jgi:hypothetical protein
MKNKNWVILLILLLVGSISFAQQKVEVVAFYNLENLFDTINDPLKNDDEFTSTGSYHYNDSIYRQKLKNIVRVFNTIATETKTSGAALIGVAEVENETVLNTLAKHPDLRNRNYKAVLLEGHDERGIDVGLIYDTSKFKLLSSKSYATQLDTGYTRDILYVTGTLQGDTIHILVNHWPSRRDGVKETQPRRNEVARTAKNLIDSIFIRKPISKIILMGDLNDNPEDYSVQHILLCKNKMHGVSTKDLYNPWYSLHNAGKGTAVYKHKWNLFDQIIISGGFIGANKGWEFSKAEIFDKDFLKQQYGKSRGTPYRSFRGTRWMNGYSDHFPVLLYLVR